jgi:hypothetical protein
MTKHCFAEALGPLQKTGLVETKGGAVVRIIPGLLIPALLGLITTAVSWAGPQVTLETETDPHRLIVDGLSIGGETAWIGIMRERPKWTTRVVRRHGLERDEDGDGRVEIALDKAVAFHSVWVVVDLTSGDWDIAVPDGFPRKELSFPVDSFRQISAGIVDSFQDTRGDIEVLLVRPTVGAWRLSASEGGAHDGDGQSNLQLRAVFSQMRPVGESPTAPGHLSPGDVLVVIDPKSLELYVARFQLGGQ